LNGWLLEQLTHEAQKFCKLRGWSREIFAPKRQHVEEKVTIADFITQQKFLCG
jgi:hypothetical protein